MWKYAISSKHTRAYMCQIVGNITGIQGFISRFNSAVSFHNVSYCYTKQNKSVHVHKIPKMTKPVFEFLD